MELTACILSFNHF